MDVSSEQRKDLVTARESLRRADLGFEDVDYATAASLIDRVLASSCPHDPANHHVSPNISTGRSLVTCHECGVSWFDDYAQRLP